MSLYLGIDIGTTSIATVIVDKSNHSVKSTFSSPHNAYINRENGAAEQDVKAIISVLVELVKRHPQNLLNNIKGIGVAGQMHGILLWNKGTKNHSNLITWQDKRASNQKILEKFQQIPNCSDLRDGYGITSLASIYYNQKNGKNDDIFDIEKNGYNSCGTIMDYLVWLLVGCPEECFIDSSNAASWGLFNIDSNEWDAEAVKKLGINFDILPEVVKSGSDVGELCNEYKNIFHINGETVKIKCPIGDNQASVLATGKNYNDESYITFGTGTQLSVVISKNDSSKLKKSPKYELRPFPFDRLLAVTAPLSGGQSWVMLKDMTKDLLKKFDAGIELSDNQIFDKLDEMALSEIDSPNLPQVFPHFFGERWGPESYGSIVNITQYNFSFAKIAAGMLIGMACNLKNNMPIECFENRHVIIGNGHFIRKSKALQKAIEKVFGLRLELTNIKEEAATGAAILTFI